jgi:hypothetical protein
LPSTTTLNFRGVSKCVAAFALPALLLIAGSAIAQVPLTQISSDTFTNTSSQHETEVEPASFAVGNTIVSVFQVGRFTDGGASDIGFSTSTDGGTTWTHGNLPGITKVEGTGPYDRASDTSVTYNGKYKVWLAETLALSVSGGVHGAAVLVSSSVDGITWGNPVTVSLVESGGYYDKPWIGCDNTSTSPFFGNCYIEWDDFSQGDLIQMSTSKDGGLTWSAKAKTGGGGGFGNGGVPLVQPNGTVIVPINDQFLSSVQAFRSTNGGSTWTAPVSVTLISEHAVAGGMRALPLIAAQMDAAGKVYVVWADCRYRSGCSSNDIVISTSTDGVGWSAPARVPIDAASSTVDHFTPGFAIERGTSGSTARLALTYNFFPKSNCTSNCSLGVGFISSNNGGTTWSAAKTVTSGMNPSWLPGTTSGQMAGDYMTAAFPGQKAHVVFPGASAPSGATLHEAMATNQFGISAAAEADEPQFSSANDKPVASAKFQVRRTTPHRDDER